MFNLHFIALGTFVYSGFGLVAAAYLFGMRQHEIVFAGPTIVITARASKRITRISRQRDERRRNVLSCRR